MIWSFHATRVNPFTRLDIQCSLELGTLKFRFKFPKTIRLEIASIVINVSALFGTINFCAVERCVLWAASKRQVTNASYLVVDLEEIFNAEIRCNSQILCSFGKLCTAQS